MEVFELKSFENKKIDIIFITKLNQYLDEFDWGIMSYILIEGQIGLLHGMGGSSVTNVKIQQHLQTYFSIKCPQIPVHIVSANSKYPAEMKGKSATKTQRKKWGVKKSKEIFRERGDEQSLQIIEKSDKQDDLADTLLIILSFFKRHSCPRKMEEIKV